ncbi:MAG: hypothetical protein LUQ30_05555, partial [Methanothrix sp.]|nr:hypothetical protein [Methanothrix sp.]
ICPAGRVHRCRIREGASPRGGVIALGSATNGEEELEVILRQPVSWTDQALDEGHRYEIAVTFTISAYN